MRWPDASTVRAALARWVEDETRRHPELLRLGYFGSYARNDAGVGSDLDLVAVVENSCEPFERRALDWDLLPLPVPAEILVYTREEWDRLSAGAGRFARMLREETAWVVERAGPAGHPTGGPSRRGSSTLPPPSTPSST